MDQEELKQRLIELLDIAVGDCNLTESEVKIVANYLIANGVTIRERGEWIPVTERLPELFEDVLCYYPNKRGSRVRVDYLEDKEDCSFGFEFCDGNVTHWMPLPEPPETEKGGAE